MKGEKTDLAAVAKSLSKEVHAPKFEAEEEQHYHRGR